MLNCFLDDETYGKVQGFVAKEFKKDRKSYPVYELLCKINSKDGGHTDADSKPPFSGEKAVGWKNTAEVLRRNGINDDMIQEKIIGEKDINKVIEYVKSISLFKNVYKSSIEAFRGNFNPKVVAVDAESPHPENGNE